jgi:hypothetical protein
VGRDERAAAPADRREPGHGGLVDRLAADDRVRRGQAGAEQAGGEHARRETEVRFMVCSGRSVG